jgi:hypothetical protein
MPREPVAAATSGIMILQYPDIRLNDIGGDWHTPTEPLTCGFIQSQETDEQSRRTVEGMGSTGNDDTTWCSTGARPFIDPDDELGLLGPEAPEHAWVGGHWENYGTLASSFMDAADTLAKVWAQSPHERLALPILQAYRHAIELALKDNCQTAAQLVHFGDRMGYGEVDEDLEKLLGKLEEKLAKTHSIAGLVDLLGKIMPGLSESRGGELPAKERATLNRLHQLDSNGTAFRYATSYDKSSGRYVKIRPTEEPIELRNLVNELHQAGWMLVYGVSGWLDNYSSWLQDMWSELKAETSDY